MMTFLDSLKQSIYLLQFKTGALNNEMNQKSLHHLLQNFVPISYLCSSFYNHSVSWLYIVSNRILGSVCLKEAIQILKQLSKT